MIEKNKKWMFPLCGPQNSIPSEFLYTISLKYKAFNGVSFHNALVKIAEAHKNHSNLHYVYYGNPIGDGNIRYFYNMDSKKCSNGFPGNEAVLREAFGEEDGNKIALDFSSALLETKKTMLQFFADLSYIDDKIKIVATPYKYLCYLIVKTNDKTFTTSYKTLIKKIFSAYQKYFNDLSWVTYKEIDSNTFHVLIPLQSYEGVDRLIGVGKLLHRYENVCDATSMLKDFYAGIMSHKSYIMSFVPGCSNFC